MPGSRSPLEGIGGPESEFPFLPSSPSCSEANWKLDQEKGGDEAAFLLKWSNARKQQKLLELVSMGPLPVFVCACQNLANLNLPASTAYAPQSLLNYGCTDTSCQQQDSALNGAGFQPCHHFPPGFD